MHRSRFGRAILLGLACLVLFPLAASAQSSIVGLVRDESGGVLPGVTVEVASPALIEKVRTSVTDEQGRYRFVDLRPGTYRVTVSLPGFSTLVRDGIELPSDFTATINAELKVGSLQETVTVSGETPIVDVQQVSRTQVMTRDVIDALPVSRNIMSIGALVPGVRQGNPDFGGSRLTEVVAIRTHGVGQTENAQIIEGFRMNTFESNQFWWFDDQMGSEVSITTSAIPADTGPGGMRLGNILKDGGNIMSGALFLGGSAGSWQSDNVDDELRALNISIATRIAQIQQFTFGFGGPIKKDKIWYYVGIRHVASDQLVANIPDVELPDGTFLRGVGENYVRGVSVRGTWQVSEKLKLSGYRDRIWKRMVQTYYANDPRTSQYRDPRHSRRGSGNIRGTFIPSSSWMLEGGFAFVPWDYHNNYMPQIPNYEPGTPGWYKWANKADTALNKNFYPDCAFVTGCLGWMDKSASSFYQSPIAKHMTMASASYVTGTHNIKVGFQDMFGRHGQSYWRFGDISLRYTNNAPSTVVVYNTPTTFLAYLNYDLGVFVQDSWTIKRLTLNPGLRVEWFNSEIRESSAEAGRFAPARFFEKQENLPNWGPDWSPRFSAAYDLFGDGKTALKASVSRYLATYRLDNFATRYANGGALSESRNWFDADLIPGTSTRLGLVLPTNGDGIAQNNEIGPSANPNFGKRADRNPAPDISRPFNWEYTASVQHEFPFAGVTAMWYRRIQKNMEISDRSLISFADYTSFQTPMPNFSNDPTLTGVLDPNEILTVYNLKSAMRSSYGVALIDSNSENNRKTYTGVEGSFRVPMRQGALMGGWAMEHSVSVFCDLNDNPNGPTASDDFGGNVSQGGRFCDQSKFDIPFQHQFKLQASYPIRNWVDFGVVFQSLPGTERNILWTPAASLFPGGRTNSETILLNKPGTLYLTRFNQIDINFKKNFRSGRKLFSLQVDLFNALNGNVIDGRVSDIGASLGNVSSINFGRLPRIAFQAKW